VQTAIGAFYYNSIREILCTVQTAIRAFHYSLCSTAKDSGRIVAYRPSHRGILLQFHKGNIVYSAIAIGAFHYSPTGEKIKVNYIWTCVKGEVNITCSSQIPRGEQFITCVNNNCLYNCVTSDCIYNTNRYNSFSSGTFIFPYQTIPWSVKSQSQGRKLYNSC
jgi:hypothetical protein